MLGWPVIGIWGDDRYDGSDVNTVCQSRAPEASYLAIGDDYGTVKLFRFPCPVLSPEYKEYTGHASHVTAVRFSRSNVLVSLGGDDHSICQWSLQDPGKRPSREVIHPWTDLQTSGMPEDRWAVIGQPRQQEPQTPALARRRPSSAAAAGARRQPFPGAVDRPDSTLQKPAPIEVPEGLANGLDGSQRIRAKPTASKPWDPSYHRNQSNGVGAALQWG